MSQEELDHVLDEVYGEGTDLNEQLESDRYNKRPSQEVLNDIVDSLPGSAMSSSLSLDRADYSVVVETDGGYVQADLEEVATPGIVEGTVHTSDDFLANAVAEDLETESVESCLTYLQEENAYDIRLRE